MNLARLTYCGATVLYALLWIGGCTSYIFTDGPPVHLQFTGPLFMLLAAALALAPVPSVHGQPAWNTTLAILAAGMAGFAIEVVGVHTGMPFGKYHYTDAFAPSVLGVPLVMVCAWAVLAAYAYTVVARIVRGRFQRVVLGAITLTGIDLVLDPVAAGPMRLWAWAHQGLYHGVPWTNFAGWFLSSLVVLTVLDRLVADPGKMMPPLWIGYSLVLFFTAVALGRGLWFAACAGLVVAAAHAYVIVRNTTQTGECAGNPSV